MAATNLAAESWTWYALTWLVVSIRMASQLLLRGAVKDLKLDDALMIFAMMTDTVLIVCMNIISHTSSNLIDPNDHIVLTSEEISERSYGSKLVLVTEQMQILTIWTVKGCLLLLYHRLTLSLTGNIAVKAVAAYVAVAFVVMEVLYLGVWCRPFSEYFAVPPNNPQCSAATNHLITNAVLNISSDLMIISIPLPMFLRSRIPVKKKMILCGVFALGSFTILSAILNKYYSFTEPFGAEWTFWYIRESSTAIIAANLPLTWNLFRRIFNLRSFSGSGSRTQSAPNLSFLRSTGTRNHSIPNPVFSRRRHGDNDDDDEDADISASQERINRAYGVPLKIYQRQDVQVRSEPAPRYEERQGYSQDSLPEGVTTTIQGGTRFDTPDEEARSQQSAGTVVRVPSGV